MWAERRGDFSGDRDGSEGLGETGRATWVAVVYDRVFFSGEEAITRGRVFSDHSSWFVYDGLFFPGSIDRMRRGSSERAMRERVVEPSRRLQFPL